MRHRLRAAGLACGAVMALCSFAARGLPQPPVLGKVQPLQEITVAEFTARIHQLQNRVAACKASAAACDANVGPDNRVLAEGTRPAFLEHWDWLRDALQDAGKAKEIDRAEQITQAAQHLSALAADAGAEPATIDRPENVARTQAKAAEVLRRPEFRPAATAQPSWLDKKWAQFWMWFAALFEGARRLGTALPWLGKLLEWGFFLLAAVGLLLFIRRNFARQQLQIALNAGAVQTSAWEREANDWAAEAEAQAQNGAWRDAVHCLYWAAIVRLESKRAWRHNPARTPREYVRLLQAGSAQQSALRELTGVFERVWYGLRDAEARDFQRAKSFFTELSESSAQTPMATSS